MASEFLFTGVTGLTYQYGICDVNEHGWQWNAVPGNYCFARWSGLQAITPIYLGETQNFQTRMPTHEKWALARHYGATLILAHVNYGGDEARKAEEADLIRAYNPPVNIQHRSGGLGLADRAGLFGLGPAVRRGKK